jgi:hypothetical protein
MKQIDLSPLRYAPKRTWATRLGSSQGRPSGRGFAARFARPLRLPRLVAFWLV